MRALQIASAWPVFENLAAVMVRAMRSLRNPTSAASGADDHLCGSMSLCFTLPEGAVQVSPPVA